jgi:hypothetical protein
MTTIAMLVTTFLCQGTAQATPTGQCETSIPRKTAYGEISRTECGTAQTGYSYAINVNGIAVLKGTYLARQDFDEKLGIWIYRGESTNQTGCPEKHYLIDISKKPTKVIAFGVKNACNEFHWSSWSAKRSVIALKNNVQFVYQNGKLTAPAPGEKLWKAIEPPHAGTGMSAEEAIPFIEEVNLPKQ